LKYQYGSYDCVPSCSSKPWFPRYEKSFFAEGASKVEDRGTGWMDVVHSSRLILTVQVDGEKKEIWMERLFRKAFGRLTQKRRDAIQRTIPETVEVVERTGRKGTKYFVLADEELQDWFARTASALL